VHLWAIGSSATQSVGFVLMVINVPEVPMVPAVPLLFALCAETVWHIALSEKREDGSSRGIGTTVTNSQVSSPSVRSFGKLTVLVMPIDAVPGAILFWLAFRNVLKKNVAARILAQGDCPKPPVGARFKLVIVRGGSLLPI